MELIEKLKQNFKGADVEVVHTNEEYGFTINILKPTKSNPYHLVFTNGLSVKGQSVPEQHQEFKYVELYFCLPDYWKPEDKSETNYWPIFWLDKIATIPQKNASWFGPGDTIPTSNPPKPITQDLQQNHFILSEPILFNAIKQIDLNDKSVHFLAVIPIYQKELDYKLRHSAKVFLSKYQYKKNTELTDKFREPVIGKVNFKYLWLIIITLLILAAVGLVIFTDGEWRPLDNHTKSILPHLKNQ